MPLHHLTLRAIREVVPHIFKRSLFTATPEQSIQEVGSYLALEGRIYLDGFPVRYGDKPIGRIGSYFIIKDAIRSNSTDWTKTPVSEIMDKENKALESTEPLAKAIEIFQHTKIGFIPVTVNGVIAATLSVRDLLKLVARECPDKSAYDVGSPVVAVEEKASLGDVIELMFKLGIRNLVIENGKKRSFLNDRNILDYLLSSTCISEWKIDCCKSLYRKSVGSIAKVPATEVAHDISFKEAASKLSSYDRPAILVRERIISPWDLTMKWLRPNM